MTIALNSTELILTILAISFGTILTRVLPFLVFREGREVPLYIRKLQVLLPPAAIGMLVVYCLKDVSFLAGTRGVPEFLAILGIVVIHRFWKNTLLSIAGGTALYMLFVQVLFTT